MPFPSPI